MTGRVFRFAAAEHKVVDVLLPWFVNGTLEGEELELVQRHLAECPRCRHEVEWLRELHAACIAGESIPGGSTAFRDLRRRLEQRRGGSLAIARLRRAWTRTRSWSRWAIAAQFLVIVALGALLYASNDGGPGQYRTLGAGNAATPGAASLVVVFDPSTPEGEVERILRATGARIVDGPTQANAYLLAVRPGQTDRAAQALKAEPAAVLVEPLRAPGAQ